MTDLVRHTGAALTAMPLNEVMTLGDVFGKSGYFSDARSQAQCVVKIMAGAELGLPPIASMQGIHVIQGKPTLSANLMAGAVKRSGRYDYRVLELTDTRCEIVYFQREKNDWQEIGRTTFTEMDARRADVKNMGKFPRNMLFARAMSNGVRFFCPDVFYGPVYTPEEFGGMTDDSGSVSIEPLDGRTGEILDGNFGTIPAPPVTDEEAKEAGESYDPGRKRMSTADNVEKHHRTAGLLTHKEWMAKHELDAENKELARHILSLALDKPITSRKDLSAADWGKANHFLSEQTAEWVMAVASGWQQVKDVQDPYAPTADTEEVIEGALVS